MIRFLNNLFLIFIISISAAFGQISPGELSASHANLEGISNCTQCHDLGKKVSNKKCLECHKEINEKIKEKRGYHSNSEVVKKDCFECHSDHHGRNFDMIHFDENKFDHNLTGYKLEAAHAIIDCRDCHKPEYIRNPEIKKRKDTFLGLDQECLACHDDFHQKTLSSDCNQCHDMKAFRPASKFDHNQADFKLKGKHIEVDCKSCHEITTRNGMEFQQFTDLKFNDCNACHNDPHNNHFASKCSQCHDENSFTTFIGKNTFNHNTTNFKLTGKHKNVDCFECHKNTNDPFSVFQDRNGVKNTNCIACHEDIHKGKFGNECAKCHSETSFLSLKTMDFFDHNVTDYPLVGKHLEVDCKKCHTERYTQAINFSSCNNCHDDYHQGEFEKNGVLPNCDLCHSLSEGFNLTSFTVERHNETDFTLVGAHLATPCFACHISEEKWTFRIEGSSCTACHENVHEDKFEIDGVTTCERCHDSNTWFPSKFDHNETAFPLEGKHAEIDCLECHHTIVDNDKTTVVYKIEKFECIDCHQ